MNDVVFLTGVCHPNSFNRAQGAYRLASVLRSNGKKVRVIDGVGTLTAEQIRRMVETSVSNRTKLFCISSTFFSNFESSMHSDSLVTTDFLPYRYDEWMSIIDQVKKNSNAKIVVGGHKTNEFEKSKHQHPYVDHFVYGYADDTILKLYNDQVHGISNMSDIISSGRFNSFETKYDANDSFLNGECFTVEMQRGCMFKCAFCAYPMNGKKRGDYVKDAKIIVDELMYCYDNFGSTNFILNSDTFNDDIRYLEQFHTQLARTGAKFNFGVNARMDLFYKDPDLIQIVKDINVRSALFGLESSNPFALKHIGKGLSFDKIVSTLHECRSVWKDQIRMTGSYIIGLPFDTEENIKQVHEFFSSSDCPLDGIEFDPLYVQNAKLDTNPWKSEYSVNADKHGFVFEEGSQLNWSNSNTPYGTFTNSVIRAEEMVKSFPDDKRGTIKSAAYMHLPVNIDSAMSSAEKFETVFKFSTYKELQAYHKSNGTTTNKARVNTANRYFDLFMKQNG